jgi:signal transduction histidine kinase
VRSFRHWRGRVFDVLVVAVAVAALVEIVLADLPRARLLMPAVVLYTLPLLLRDRWPFAMPVLVIVVQVLVSFLDAPGGARENWGVVAYVLAFWALGAYNPLGAAVAGLGVALAGVVVVTFEDVRVPADDAFSVALVGSLTWLAGVVLRRRSLLADQAEQRAAAFERDHRDTETAVAEERARIARELHDVVAHSVSVMTVQAGAARMLLNTDPQRAVAPLLAVEEAGRQALAELRRLLGILRTDEGGAGLVPQPDIEDLPELIETVRAAGLLVELVEDGDVRPVAPGPGLAAYRIVQEALTNTLKHAGAEHVVLTMDYGADQLRIEVRDDGRRAHRAAGHGGHGLAGMRERAAVYGGVLEAGPEHGGGYAVRASLPIERAAP